MKLDFIITELDVGGAERCLSELALHAKAEGHEVRVISLGPPPPTDRDGLFQKLAKDKVEVHFLGGRNPWQLLRVVSRLKRLIRANPPDIAQSFLFHANVIAAWVYPGLGVPLVGGVRVAEPRRWRQRLGGWAATKMTKVVCVSQSCAAWCRVHERIPDDKLVVIPNGIELERQPSGTLCANSIPDELKKERPFLLFVGRLDFQKGVDQLIQHADRILTTLPEWDLVLVGEGPLRSSLEKQIQNDRHRDRIHWVGWQPNPRAWMEASSLVLLPTRYEGMPNVLLEAMAESRPFLAMAVEGVPELLGLSHVGVPHDRKSKSGEESNDDPQLCPAGDWATFEKKLIHLASNPNLRKELGSSNRRTVEDRFSLKDQLSLYTQLYATLTNKLHSSP